MLHIFSSCKLHPLQRGRVSLVPRLISSVREKGPGYEAKGLVTLQPWSCHHGRNLMSPIKSALVVGRVMEYNYIKCKADVGILLSNPCSVIAFLGDNSMVVA